MNWKVYLEVAGLEFYVNLRHVGSIFLRLNDLFLVVYNVCVCYSVLLAVGLVPTIVLELDVQVQGNVAAVDFVALLVRAGERFLDLLRRTAVLLLLPGVLGLG